MSDTPLSILEYIPLIPSHIPIFIYVKTLKGLKWHLILSMNFLALLNGWSGTLVDTNTKLIVERVWKVVKYTCLYQHQADCWKGVKGGQVHMFIPTPSWLLKGCERWSSTHVDTNTKLIVERLWKVVKYTCWYQHQADCWKGVKGGQVHMLIPTPSWLLKGCERWSSTHVDTNTKLIVERVWKVVKYICWYQHQADCWKGVKGGQVHMLIPTPSWLLKGCERWSSTHVDTNTKLIVERVWKVVKYTCLYQHQADCWKGVKGGQVHMLIPTPSWLLKGCERWSSTHVYTNTKLIVERVWKVVKYTCLYQHQADCWKGVKVYTNTKWSSTHVDTNTKLIVERVWKVVRYTCWYQHQADCWKGVKGGQVHMLIPTPSWLLKGCERWSGTHVNTNTKLIVERVWKVVKYTSLYQHQADCWKGVKGGQVHMLLPTPSWLLKGCERWSGTHVNTNTKLIVERVWKVVKYTCWYQHQADCWNGVKGGQVHMLIPTPSWLLKGCERWPSTHVDTNTKLIVEWVRKVVKYTCWYQHQADCWKGVKGGQVHMLIPTPSWLLKGCERWSSTHVYANTKLIVERVWKVVKYTCWYQHQADCWKGVKGGQVHMLIPTPSWLLKGCERWSSTHVYTNTKLIVERVWKVVRYTCWYQHQADCWKGVKGGQVHMLIPTPSWLLKGCERWSGTHVDTNTKLIVERVWKVAKYTCWYQHQADCWKGANGGQVHMLIPTPSWLLKGCERWSSTHVDTNTKLIVERVWKVVKYTCWYQHQADC